MNISEQNKKITKLAYAFLNIQMFIKFYRFKWS